jgi:ketosteroid isomerase-like protein
VGTPTVRGKRSLREYWTMALARLASLRFTVDRVVWDADSRELAIIYTSETDGKARRVSENLRFDAAGQIVVAEVFHGVAG